ncbi:hypothetical protein V1264_019637 [Littorina saxatilis]|uniref:Uncharacterized protein n=1 Tax=Littorina saxatilis TaxID=31220 RepID=A0AAN9BGF4_9CAEN
MRLWGHFRPQSQSYRALCMTSYPTIVYMRTSPLHTDSERSSLLLFTGDEVPVFLPQFHPYLFVFFFGCITECSLCARRVSKGAETVELVREVS